MTTRVIVVWTCPHPECSNYYGSEGTPDLSTSWNRDIKSKKTSTRDTCQSCRLAGRGTVLRVPRFAIVTDISPKDVEAVDESELVRRAYRLLKEEGHESIG